MNGNCINYTVLLQPEGPAVTTAVTTTTAPVTTTTEPTATTTVTAAPETAPETTVTAAFTPMPGDVNCSGNVDVSDAVLLARFIAEDSKAAISAEGKINADCNGDREYTGADTTLILQFIAKIIDKLG